MRRIVLLIAFATGLPGVVSAQNVYKCGNTYSETPCATDAKPMDSGLIKPQAPRVAPSAEKVQRNMDLCKSVLRSSLKDPNSAQIKDETRLSKLMDGVNFSTFERFPAVGYSMQVNAKNSYGGYTGYKTGICYFDLAEEKIKSYKILLD